MRQKSLTWPKSHCMVWPLSSSPDNPTSCCLALWSFSTSLDHAPFCHSAIVLTIPSSSNPLTPPSVLFLNLFPIGSQLDHTVFFREVFSDLLFVLLPIHTHAIMWLSLGIYYHLCVIPWYAWFATLYIYTHMHQTYMYIYMYTYTYIYILKF